MSIAAGPALPCIVSRPSVREGELAWANRMQSDPPGCAMSSAAGMKPVVGCCDEGMRAEHRRKVARWCERVGAADEINIRSTDYSFAGRRPCLVCQCFPARTE